MSTAPVQGQGSSARVTVVCTKCKLVQFQTSRDKCRRCSALLSVPGVSMVSANLRETFHKRFRRLRVMTGMNATQFAKSSGLTRTYLYKLEVGQILPTAERAARLFEALGVTAKEFLNDGDFKPSGIDCFTLELMRELHGLKRKQLKDVLRFARALSKNSGK